MTKKTHSIAKYGRQYARYAARVALIGSAVMGAQTASAQQTGGETVYVDLGRWVILEDQANRMCELRLTSDRRTMLRYFKRDGAPGSLRLQSRNGAFSSTFVGGVTWAFDDTQFGGQLSRGMYAVSSDTSAVEAEFRRARFLTVNHAGQTVTRVSLQTSSAGFRLLNQCAQQWRFPNPFTSRTTIARADTRGGGRNFTSAPAAPASSRPAPASTRPPTSLPPPPPAPSQARNPIPRNQSRWIQSGDYNRFRPENSVSGRLDLDFTLVVDRRGRVDECIVNSTSGSREFDRMSCRILQRRARFDPALDRSGQDTAGRFSSSLRYQIPE